MNLSKQDLRNYSILAVFFIGIAIYLYTQLSTPDAPAPAPAAVVTTTPTVKPSATGTPATAAFTTAQLDPTLHPEAMLVTESLVYSGSGRNIFSTNSAPASAAARQQVARVTIPQPIAPIRPVQTGPAAPPAIDLKFFGTETTASGTRRGFLLHGDDVFLVASGDIVQRRYRVLSIDARSMQVEDIANANKQTLPLLAN